ncbi:MAG: tRNA pseudouridine synthase A, partial [Simkania negevensis]|nr:tRNA pseudouridine synthase A [Simkania negevensis]
ALQAASRTDAGVHAEGQVVNFFSDKELDLYKLSMSLNEILPADISIRKIEEADFHFHPTLDAVKKEYHYLVNPAPFQLPFYRHVAWYLPFPLDLAKIKKALPFFLGRKDFIAFSNQGSTRSEETLCTLFRVEMIQIEAELLRFELEGDRFLYKMARNLVGSLVDYGRGKIEEKTLVTLLEKKDRTLAGVTAPAHGLTLKKVYY